MSDTTTRCLSCGTRLVPREGSSERRNLCPRCRTRALEMPAPTPADSVWTRPTLFVAAGAVLVLVTRLLVRELDLRATADEPTYRVRPVHAAFAPKAAAGPLRPLPPVVKRDDAGLPLRVAAEDPGTALRALCAEPAFEGAVPAGIAPVVADTTARLGLVDVTRPRPALRAVTIRLDPRDGRWAIGNGLMPIELQPAPAGAAAIWERASR
jgi:DNA-directed RNA polymerase subunit RPC12/RpoP